MYVFFPKIFALARGNFCLSGHLALGIGNVMAHVAHLGPEQHMTRTSPEKCRV
jgi:hypothetical protein